MRLSTRCTVAGGLIGIVALVGFSVSVESVGGEPDVSVVHSGAEAGTERTRDSTERPKEEGAADTPVEAGTVVEAAEMSSDYVPAKSPPTLLALNAPPTDASDAADMAYLSSRVRRVLHGRVSDEKDDVGDVEELLLVTAGHLNATIDGRHHRLDAMDLHYSEHGPVPVHDAHNATWLSIRFRGTKDSLSKQERKNVERDALMHTSTFHRVDDWNRFRRSDQAHFFWAKHTRTIPRLNLATIFMPLTSKVPRYHPHTFASFTAILSGHFHVEYVDSDHKQRIIPDLHAGSVVFFYDNSFHRVVRDGPTIGTYVAIQLEHRIKW